MDVEAWLEGMGLERYAEAFRAADIDGEVLPELTESDLEKLGVTLGYRKRLLRAIAVLDAADRSAPAGPGAPAVPDARALRPATVMFADLCGFTRLSRELDPESLHALLSAFLAAVDRRIVEHGGWIDKHLGDGVMAVFGAPVAHDNDAERAVRAALAVREAMAPLSAEQGRPLAVHVGIASGQVLAGGTGDAGRSGYTVTGQSVNLASRLSDAARPDEILVSDRVRRVLMDRIEGEDAGALTVEGFAEPVRAWRLSGLRAPAAAPRRPLIGRQGEMAQFEALLAATRRTGSGRVVHLRGEAGIGKSRLLEEWLRLAGEHGFDRHCALVLDLGAGRGRDAVRVLVRGLLGLDRSADAGAIGRAAAAAVAEGLVDADDVVHLNDLLDRPQPPELRALNNAMDNAARRLGKRRTWATLLSRRSARRPQMVAVEDVHWADAVTLDHLSGLAAAVAGCPALLVLTSRLEGDPLDARWRAAAGGTGVSTVDLGPMRPEDGLALARAMGRFDETVIERCLARADGNPLFLEQLLRHAGDAAEPVPGSVQSLTQARLDRLEPADRHALQAASVLGQRFSLDGLRHLIGDTGYDPARLIDRGLLRPHGDGLLFAHALIRDAVYDSLLREMRRGWHRKAADWHGDDDPALRAEHLGRAADPGAPAAHARAAAVETRQLRFERALALCERGLALAAPGRDRTALALMRADLLRELGRPRPSIDAFRACLDETSETPARCRALIGIAAGVRLVGGHAEGMEALATAEPLAIAEDASLERSQIGYYRGCLLYAAGDVEGCLAQHQGGTRPGAPGRRPGMAGARPERHRRRLLRRRALPPVAEALPALPGPVPPARLRPHRGRQHAHDGQSAPVPERSRGRLRGSAAGGRHRRPGGQRAHGHGGAADPGGVPGRSR